MGVVDTAAGCAAATGLVSTDFAFAADSTTGSDFGVCTTAGAAAAVAVGAELVGALLVVVADCATGAAGVGAADTAGVVAVLTVDAGCATGATGAAAAT